MTFQLSAGVYTFEIDKSTFVSAGATSIGAAVAGLVRGPLGPQLCTSVEDYINKYGETPASWSKAPYCIKAALNTTAAFYVNRVVNGALYSGTAYFNDSMNKNLVAAPFPTGSSSDYDSGSRDLELLSIDNPLLTGNKVEVNLDDEEGTVEVIEQDFSNSSNETLALLAQTIQTKLNVLGEGGEAKVIKVWNGANRNMQQSITFSEPLTASNFTAFSMDISVMGAAVESVNAAFSTDNDTTLQAVATAISAISGVNAQVKPGVTPGTANTVLINCDTAGPNSFVLSNIVVTGTTPPTTTQAITKEGHGVYDDRVIQITMPLNSQAYLTNPNISGGTSQASIEVQTNVKVLDIFAENPGDWANQYGTTITNIDYGTASRSSITFAGPLVLGNVFSCSLALGTTEYPISVNFATSSDNTLNLIAQAIKNTLSPLGRFGDAFVQAVVGGTENDRVLTVVSPTSAEDVSILNITITGGATQTTATSAEILNSIPSNNTFKLNVYVKTDINNPVESYTCSLTQQLDGNGNQQFIEEVVNKGSNASKFIRVKVNNLALLQLENESLIISWLSGGDNGAIPTNAQIAAGWDAYSSAEKITVRLLVNCGYTNVSVQQKMVSICQNRKDCFAILDVPSDQQSATAAINYRKFVLNVNSSYAAIYSNDVLMTDPVTGMQLYVPPSGSVCAQYAYTDLVAQPWFAPAGLNRGLVQNIQGVRYKYEEGERDLLAQNQVNYIRDMPGKGYPIWEEYTLQSKSSALSDVHVRRLLISLEVSTTDYLEYGVFDPNDQILRDTLLLAVQDYLIGLQRLRAFHRSNGEDGFYVVSDSSNNPDYLADQGIMVMDIYIKPIGVAKFIKLNVVLTKKSASFSELVAA